MSMSFIPLLSAIMQVRLRGAGIPLFILGFLLISLSVSVLAMAGGIGPVRAQQGESVTNLTVKAFSRSPAARTGYEVTFTTPKHIEPLTGSIVMELHEDIGVPGGIAPNSVRLEATNGSEDCSASLRGAAAFAELTDHDDPRRPTIIRIAHNLRDGQSPAKICEDSEVTVTFDRNAGLSNPTEGGAFSWKVGVENDNNLVNAMHPDENVREAFKSVEGVSENEEKELYGLLVDWEIQLSDTDVGRDEEVTVIGRGYKNGTTLTFWRDANFDGVRDLGEPLLCQALVEANDIGYCSFTVTKPTFVAGHGECVTAPVIKKDGSYPQDTNRREAAQDSNCNFINAADGLNHSSIWIGELEEIEIEGQKHERYNLEALAQVLDLHGLVIADADAGWRLFIRLLDIPRGHLLEADIGGVPLDLGDLANSRIPDSGSLHFSVDLPGGTRRGYQTLRVLLSHADIDPQDTGYHHEVSTTLWVEPHAVVTAFPEEVLPNQRINLEGKGFIVEDGVGEIVSVGIGGHSLDLSRVNNGKEAPLATDRHGNWNGYVDLPVNSATTTPGTREIQITDSYGRKGLVEVTIPPREVVVTPIWSRPGTVVTVTGTGFPARNDNRSSVNLRIHYETSVGSVITSAAPDANGNFSQEVRIHLKTPAPSSNTVRVEFNDDDGAAVVTTTSHEIAGAAVTLTPEAGPPGTPVSLSGQGFRKFAPVNLVKIGAMDVTPGGSETTDANGEFTLTFLVPGIGAGQQNVRASVAGVTASASFNISLSGVSEGAPTPVAEALEKLGDRFVRSFHFNNDTKVWTYYDPELAEDENTQQFMVTGETYLVLVRENVEAVLNGKARQLTCRQGNCWNQIIW